jgi:hypothetical protein
VSSRPRQPPARRVERDGIIEHVQAHAVGHGVPSVGAARASAVFVAGSPAIAMTAAAAGHRSFKTESLGKKVFEGVEADGTRTVSTIAAGEIGNERDIEIVDETRYSRELEALVYSSRRSGDRRNQLPADQHPHVANSPSTCSKSPRTTKSRRPGRWTFKIRTKKLDQ